MLLYYLTFVEYSTNSLYLCIVFFILQKQFGMNRTARKRTSPETVVFHSRNQETRIWLSRQGAGPGRQWCHVFV